MAKRVGTNPDEETVRGHAQDVFRRLRSDGLKSLTVVRSRRDDEILHVMAAASRAERVFEARVQVVDPNEPRPPTRKAQPGDTPEDIVTNQEAIKKGAVVAEQKRKPDLKAEDMKDARSPGPGDKRVAPSTMEPNRKIVLE